MSFRLDGRTGLQSARRPGGERGSRRGAVAWSPLEEVGLEGLASHPIAQAARTFSEILLASQQPNPSNAELRAMMQKFASQPHAATADVAADDAIREAAAEFVRFGEALNDDDQPVATPARRMREALSKALQDRGDQETTSDRAAKVLVALQRSASR